MGYQSVNSSREVRKKTEADRNILGVNGDMFPRNRLKSSEKIVAEIQQNPKITISKLAIELGISTRAVEKQLASLKKSNRIRRVGSRKVGYWEVLKSL
ncbi:MAG: HTH domain-containing protein [SAR324 cluster bacterium]|nr:HTH domain-containing protein [SAR324 cluster bacterium]